MKTLSIIICTFLISYPLSAQYLLENDYIELHSQSNSIKGIEYNNLKIYPLIAGEQFLKSHASLGSYTSLEEALQNKKVEIIETGNVQNDSTSSDASNVVQTNTNDLQNIEQQNIQQVGAFSNDQVNKLFIKNLSSDTIFLMAGEVVHGGKQDRVLSQDLILPPTAALVDLTVFCVEQNRWSYSDANKSFTGYAMMSSQSLRHTITKNNTQTGVWDKVEEISSQLEVSSPTNSLTATTESTKNKEIQQYISFFDSTLTLIPNCIGFVALSGDKILGCDIFATNDLFVRRQKNLLNSYVTEAVINGSPIKMKDEQVIEYLNKFLLNEPEQDDAINEMGNQYKYLNKKLHISTY